MNPTQARREQQLRQLVVEGVPLHTLGKSRMARILKLTE